jgi:hypothetical protein
LTAGRGSDVQFPWGHIVRDPRPLGRGRPAAYDWRGVRYEWHPSLDARVRKAFDVERLDTPRPQVLIPKGWDTVTFLSAWTRAEATCKLLDMPILLWLRANPLRAVVPDAWMQGGNPWSSRCWTYTGLCRSASVVYTFGVEFPESVPGVPILPGMFSEVRPAPIQPENPTIGGHT